MAEIARELSRPVKATAATTSATEPLPLPGRTAPDDPAAPILAHLARIYQDAMFDLFAKIVPGAQLCRRTAGSRHLEIVFPQSHVMSSLPTQARRYVEDKIWVLREAIVTRCEHFLEKSAASRGLAMSYSQYLACCHLDKKDSASINPATAHDAWVNFLYALIVRMFPQIQSNGALLNFASKHLDELWSKIETLLSSPKYVVDPGAVRQQMAREERMTTIDEPLDFDSPPIVHLVQLLVAEALHVRASRVVILPLQDRIEVALRVHKAVYVRESLPLRLLYPILARLRMLAGIGGDLELTIGQTERTLRVSFHATEHGLAARIELPPDKLAIARCRALAARYGHEFKELEEVQVPRDLIGSVSKRVAWDKIVLPLSLDGDTLKVVLGDLPTKRTLDELRLAFNRTVNVAMAPEHEVLAAIYRHYHPVEKEPQASKETKTLLLS
jgi:hypothetical protein